MIFIPVLLSVGIWAWLLVGRGAFWRSGPVLGAAHPTRPLKVTVVIPARDEAEHTSTANGWPHSGRSVSGG
jgi:hypothetical protein